MDKAPTFPDPNEQSNPTVDSIIGLAREAFPQIDHDEPVLGAGDHVIAPNLKTLLERPTTILATQENEHGETIGFSMAIPMPEMDPINRAESDDTAYVYYTAIKESERGKKLVAPLMRKLHDELIARGYSFMERDSIAEDGYADSISRAYGKSIMSQGDPVVKYPEFGAEVPFVIDLRDPSKLP